MEQDETLCAAAAAAAAAVLASASMPNFRTSAVGAVGATAVAAGTECGVSMPVAAAVASLVAVEAMVASFRDPDRSTASEGFGARMWYFSGPK